MVAQENIRLIQLVYSLVWLIEIRRQTLDRDFLVFVIFSSQIDHYAMIRSLQREYNTHYVQNYRQMNADRMITIINIIE